MDDPNKVRELKNKKNVCKRCTKKLCFRMHYVAELQ